MSGYRLKLNVLIVAVLIGLACRVTSAQQFAIDRPPAGVAGNWVIYANNIDKSGSSLKTVQISQDGNLLTGYFKGPNQSGKIQGWVTGNHVEFSTDTRTVLTFRGQMQGDVIEGMYGIRGRHGEWRAQRTN